MANHTYVWKLPRRIFTLSARPLIMGIVNVTTDSFSDGGLYASPDQAVAHGLRLIDEGADILDIGGESTRPGADVIPAEQELRRVEPVVKELAANGSVPISVDTSKASVAKACLQLGAEIINDVTAFTADEAMTETVRQYEAAAILMHMQGTPRTMQQQPKYDNVVEEIRSYLQQRMDAVTAAGVPRERLAIDPGIGFGKTLEHNVEILRHLDSFQTLERPLCLGVSRKSLIDKMLKRPVHQRLAGSLTVLCHAMSKHAVQIIRVHDVAETRDAVTAWQALSEPPARV